MEYETKGKEGTSARGQRKESKPGKVNKAGTDGKLPEREMKGKADDVSNSFPNFSVLNEEEKLAFFEALSAARKSVEKRGEPTRERFGTIHDQYLLYFAQDDKEEKADRKPDSAGPVAGHRSPKEYNDKFSKPPKKRVLRSPKPVSPLLKNVIRKTPPRPESEPIDKCEAIIQRDTDNMIQLYLNKKKRIEEQERKSPKEKKLPQPKTVAPNSPKPKQKEMIIGLRAGGVSEGTSARAEGSSRMMSTPQFQALDPREQVEFFRVLQEARANIVERNPQKKNQIVTVEDVVRFYERRGGGKVTTVCTASEDVWKGKEKEKGQRKNLRVKVILSSGDNKRLIKTKSEILSDNTKEGLDEKKKSLESSKSAETVRGKKSKVSVSNKEQLEEDECDSMSSSDDLELTGKEKEPVAVKEVKKEKTKVVTQTKTSKDCEKKNYGLLRKKLLEKKKAEYRNAQKEKERLQAETKRKEKELLKQKKREELKKKLQEREAQRKKLQRRKQQKNEAAKKVQERKRLKDREEKNQVKEKAECSGHQTESLKTKKKTTEKKEQKKGTPAEEKCVKQKKEVKEAEECLKERIFKESEICLRERIIKESEECLKERKGVKESEECLRKREVTQSEECLRKREVSESEECLRERKNLTDSEECLKERRKITESEECLRERKKVTESEECLRERKKVTESEECIRKKKELKEPDECLRKRKGAKEPEECLKERRKIKDPEECLKEKRKIKKSEECLRERKKVTESEECLREREKVTDSEECLKKKEVTESEECIRKRKGLKEPDECLRKRKGAKEPEECLKEKRKGAKEPEECLKEKRKTKEPEECLKEKRKTKEPEECLKEKRKTKEPEECLKEKRKTNEPEECLKEKRKTKEPEECLKEKRKTKEPEECLKEKRKTKEPEECLKEKRKTKEPEECLKEKRKTKEPEECLKEKRKTKEQEECLKEKRKIKKSEECLRERKGVKEVKESEECPRKDSKSDIVQCQWSSKSEELTTLVEEVPKDVEEILKSYSAEDWCTCEDEEMSLVSLDSEELQTCPSNESSEGEEEEEGYEEEEDEDEEEDEEDEEDEEEDEEDEEYEEYEEEEKEFLTDQSKGFAGEVNLAEEERVQEWRPACSTGKVILVDGNVIAKIKGLIQYLENKVNPKDDLENEYVRLVLSYTEYLTKMAESFIKRNKERGQKVHRTYTAHDVRLKFKDKILETPAEEVKFPRSISDNDFHPNLTAPGPSGLEKTQQPSGVEKTQQPSGVEKTQQPSGVEKTQQPSGVEKTQQPSGVEKTQQPSGVEKTQADKLNRKPPDQNLLILSDSDSSENSDDEKYVFTTSFVKKPEIPTTKIRLLQDLLKGRAGFVEGSIDDLKVIHYPEKEFVSLDKVHSEMTKELNDSEDDNVTKVHRMKFLKQLVKLCKCGKKEVEEDAILENLKGEAVRVDMIEGRKDPASATINPSTMEVLKAAERKKIINKYFKKDR